MLLATVALSQIPPPSFGIAAPPTFLQLDAAPGYVDGRTPLTLAAIHAHNAKGSEVSWSEGVNRFTDMAPEEFSRYKGKVFDGREPASGYMKFDAGIAPADFPASVDWRTKGVQLPASVVCPPKRAARNCSMAVGRLFGFGAVRRLSPPLGAKGRPLRSSAPRMPSRRLERS